MNDELTLGILNVDGEVFHTLENPWKDNQREISCIPEGDYLVKPYSSQKYPDVYELQEVPDRSKILIHVGNYEKDTKGCILLGMGVDLTNNMITHSSRALNRFRNLIGNNTFYLSIFNKYI